MEARDDNGTENTTATSTNHDPTAFPPRRTAIDLVEGMGKFRVIAKKRRLQAAPPPQFPPDHSAGVSGLSGARLLQVQPMAGVDDQAGAQIPLQLPYSSKDHLEFQAREAETHQHCVDKGLCWQMNYPVQTWLEPSVVAYSENLPLEALSLLTWTGPQKETFIELVGRRSKSALPEIAKIVGKSVAECQAYLNLLEQNSKTFVIDVAEIPSAVEAPHDHDVSLTQASDGDNDGKAGEGPLFNVSEMRRKRRCIHRRFFTPGTLKLWHNAVRERVRDWLLMTRKYIVSDALGISAEMIRFVVSQEALEEAGGHGPKDPLLGIESPETAAQTAEPQCAPNSPSSEAEEEDEDDDQVSQLIAAEAEWLEQLDAFGARLALIQRGWPGVAGPPLMPPLRSMQLEKFMQSRE